MKFKAPLAAVALVAVAAATPAGAVTMPIDLNTWSVIDPGGTWTVSMDGTNVFQSVNGSPTIFGSPNDFSNTTFNGSFGVETIGDDDYIGFVFGLKSSTEYWLFDWKQGNQSGSSLGFTLAYVDGTEPPFGNHQTSVAGYTVVETNLGTGWADNQPYDFLLTYQDNRIKIDIDGGVFSNETIFDVTSSDPDIPADALDGGNFMAGKFGFFNHSQGSVRYQGFTEEETPPCGTAGQPACPVSEPGGVSGLALFGLGLAGLAAVRRRRTA